MGRNKFRPFVPVIILFILVNAFVVAARESIESRGFDQAFLVYGNLLLFAVTFFSYLISRRGLQATNPNAFVRAITTSMIVKMMLVIAAVAIYIVSAGADINKPSLFATMILYLVYTFLEVGILMKQARDKANG
jgi:hypothetical protein